MFNIIHYRRQYRLTAAFKKLFYDETGGRLKPEAEEILAYLRDECNAKGALGELNAPFYYDNGGRCDPGAAGFILGKRRVFDLIVKYLSLDETAVFRLLAKRENEEELLENDLSI